MEAWARHLADAFGHPVRLVDAHGRILHTNSAWRRLEADLDSTSPRAWRRLVADPEDLARLNQVNCAATHEGEGGGSAWVRLIDPADPAGRDRWWAYTCLQVLNDAGSERLGCIEMLRSAGGSHDGERQLDVLERAQELVHVGAWDLDLTDGALWWSDEVYRIFGFQPQEFAATYELFIASVHPEDRATIEGVVAQSVEHDKPYDVRHRIRRPDGEVRHVREQGVVTRDPDGTALRMLGTVSDITEQVLDEEAKEGAREALAASEERYRLLAENASDVVWQVDEKGRISWVSESVTAVLGWQPHEVVGRLITELVHPDDRPRVRDVSAVLAGNTGAEEFRLLRANGSYLWMSSTVHATRGPAGVTVVGSLRDIQGRVDAQNELEHAVGHDRLTGLATREVTVARVATHLRLASRGSRVVGVMCIGVDDLSTINDAYGHASGDRVLIAVAGRIVGAVGDADLVGRGAGNEVHVVLPQLASGADAGILAERMRRAVTAPLGVGVTEVNPTVSIGIATGAAGSDPEDLLSGAGLAMRQAKARGRDRYEFLDTHLAAEAQSRLAIEAGIREGLAADEFVPWFQPIVCLTTRKVVGHEALVRWITGDGPPVEAWRFLPMAERGHLIADIDLVVLEKSLAELAAGGGSGGYVAVNVSAESLRRGDYDIRVLDGLERWGVSAKQLHLEVTETALLSVTDEIRSMVTNLADHGVRWYVDDFGTGYSSISHLRDLPIAGLKLDKSFTAGLGEGDETCRRLADGLIGLAAGLGLDTVAEGVETEQEQAILAEQGWRCGQGWLYGRPAPRR